MKDKGDPSHVAVYRLSASKEEFEVVPVNHLKHFAPSHLEDFTRDKLYRLKPPNASKSSYVFVLGLGNSLKDAKDRMKNGRIRYPNRRKYFHLQRADPTTTEDEDTQKTSLTASQALRKDTGNLQSMKNIMAKYRPSPLESHDEGQSRVKNKHGCDRKLPHNSSAVVPPKVNDSTELSSPDVNALRDELPSVSNEISGPSTSQGFSKEQDFNGMPSIAEALKEMQKIKDYIDNAQAEVNAKLEECARERVKLAKERELFEKQTHAVLHEIREERRKVDETGALINAKVLAMKSITSSSSSSSVSSKSSVTSSFGASEDASATSEDTADEVKVHLGKEVKASLLLWKRAKDAKTKEDWAMNALLAVFGSDAQYMRIRKPRLKDSNLRTIPATPPYIYILERHYEKWLERNPDIVEYEDKILYTRKTAAKGKAKDDNQQLTDTELIEEVVPENATPAESGLNGSENEEFRTLEQEKKRLEKVIATLVRGLKELLGNKAQDLYYKNHPKEKKSKGKKDDRSSSSSSNVDPVSGRRGLNRRNPFSSDSEDEDIIPPTQEQENGSEASRNKGRNAASPICSRQSGNPTSDSDLSDSSMSPTSKVLRATFKRRRGPSFTSGNRCGPTVFDPENTEQFCPLAGSTEASQHDSDETVFEVM